MTTQKALKLELYNLEQERDEYLPWCTWHPRYTELCNQIIAKKAEITARLPKHRKEPEGVGIMVDMGFGAGGRPR